MSCRSISSSEMVALEVEADGKLLAADGALAIYIRQKWENKKVSKHLNEDRGRTSSDTHWKHAGSINGQKKTLTKVAKASHYEISCSHLSRDFNSDFVKNLIHNVLAFFFIIRAIKDVIKGVIDLEGKERGTKQCITS